MTQRLKFEKFSSDQAYNREILRQGVVEVECTAVGKKDDVMEKLTEDQKAMLEAVENALTDFYHASTIEAYANDALNIYIKNEAKSTIGVYVCRVEVNNGLH